MSYVNWQEMMFGPACARFFFSMLWGTRHQDKTVSGELFPIWRGSGSVRACACVSVRFRVRGACFAPDTGWLCGFMLFE